MENAAYPLIAPDTELTEYIGLQNQRLSRLAAQVGRIQRLRSRFVSAATTLTEVDDVLLVTTSGGNVTVTLPLAAAVPGKEYRVKKMSAANTLTLQRAGSDTIDGSATLAWTTQYQAYTVVSAQVSTGVFNWVVTSTY